MYIESRFFLKKLFSQLMISNYNKVKFSADELKSSVAKLEDFLRKELNEEQFNEINDLFLKDSISRNYNSFRDIVMTLNGNLISFASPDNPTWQELTINISENKARSIIDNNDIISMDSRILEGASRCFFNISYDSNSKR